MTGDSAAKEPITSTTANPAKHVVLKSESRPEARSDNQTIGVSATDFGSLGGSQSGEIDSVYRTIGLAGRVWYLKGARWKLLIAVFPFVVAVASAVIELADDLAEHRFPLPVLNVLGVLILVGLVVSLVRNVDKIGKPSGGG
jgi:hypothetical protein